MSSFIGHALAAYTIYSFPQKSDNQGLNVFWLACLTISALMPDIDYLIAALNSKNNSNVRITHSISVSLLLPALLILVLAIARHRELGNSRRYCQLILAGLSHIVLDLLVGVTPAALLWPLSSDTLKLPFGLLPSAGKIDLNNYYFYRNLVIESGILIPVARLIMMIKGNRPHQTDTAGKIELALLIALLAICLSFSIRLKR